MLIILERRDRPSAVYGPSILDAVRPDLTFGEYTDELNRWFIAELGIPAVMFRGVTTGRISSNMPNMSVGSVSRITVENTNVEETGH